ncbi:MAG: glycosyltransferase family 39 protein [Anaerolineae bacterium]|nr:glycosyltransferase family 39 protein [Anaerolineae bacterium]
MHGQSARGRLPGAAGNKSSRPLPVSLRVWLLTLLILIGAVLRIRLLTEFRFHADEALFATLGRLIIEGIDPLLVDTPLLVDKPPLFYYLLSLGISIEWDSELTARLPGLFASLISIALVVRLAWNLWRSHWSMFIAAAFYVLSPFAIQFSPTAFADPPMVMWMLAACVVITSHRKPSIRWFWAGVLLGLSFATKQSGMFFLPLVFVLGLITDDVSESFQSIVLFLAALGLIVLLIAAWDWIRAPAPAFWAAGMEANNPGRFVSQSELLPRARAWSIWLQAVGGNWFTNILLLVLLTILLPLEWIVPAPKSNRRWSAAIFIFVVGYVLFHWLVAVPVWDRYILPLVPLIALLVGRSLILLTDLTVGWLSPSGDRFRAAALILCVAVLVSPAIRASEGQYPVGSDHGAYDGIDELADYLKSQPMGTVIYYGSLGWTLHYYLFDSYLYLTYVESPEILSEDLIANAGDGSIRMLVLPGWEDHVDDLIAVEQAGFSAEKQLETYNRFGDISFVVYQIIPPPE